MDSKGGGRAHDFVLNGSYTYYSKSEPGTSDTLIMECHGSDVTFIAYGFLVRYLLKIRENYFGENIHFQTLEEFTHKQSTLPETEDSHEAETEFTHTKTENDLDVLIYVYVTNGTIILPCNIYSAESHIMLNFASFDTDVRFTNYYMDLQANISPIKGMYNVVSDHDKLLNLSRDCAPFEPTIFIDGIIAHGNRLFGLPPAEPTYFCKWDFDLGSVLINGPLEIIQYLGQVAGAAGYTYLDTENGLLIPEPIVYDVTYLSLRIASLKVVLKVEETSLEIAASSISLDLNDLANERYSSRITISIPSIRLGLYDITVSKDDDIHRKILASAETSILITDFVQKRNFSHCREKQQQHIALHDAPYDRCPFLLDESHRVNHRKPVGNIVPSIPLSLVPPELTIETLKYIDPNMVDTLGLSDLDEGDSSASSRSQFSNTDSASNVSSTSEASDDKKPHTESINYTFKFGGNEISGNAFLPPDSWKQFEQVASEFREKLPDFGLNPTCYYSNEEAICPTGPLDPEIEYDSFIIQLGDVAGFVSPRGISALSVLLQASQQKDLQSAMDTIQIDVLNNLNYIRTGKPETKNFRVSVSSIDIKYGTLTGSSEVEIQQQYEKNVSHIALKCDAIAVALRSSQNKIPQADVGEYLASDLNETPATISIYAGCQNLMVGIMCGLDDMNLSSDSGQIHHTDHQPLLLQFENPEFWFHEGETQNSSSLRLKNINLSVMNKHLDWVCSFCERSLAEVKKFEKKDKVRTHHNQTRDAYVLHTLSLAGEYFNIEDDPSVLTRPAFIIQSSKHVRANDSWKIIVRLRHILKSVPSDWRQMQDRLVQRNEFEPVNLEEAKKDVLNVFNRWRSWEMESMERSYVFRHGFNATTLQDTLLSKSMAVVVDLESVAIRLHYAEKEDFLCFDYVKLSAGWKSKTEAQPPPTGVEPLNVDCSLGCSNIRSRVSENMLEAYEQVAPYINVSDASPSLSSSSASLSSHKTLPAPVPSDRASKIPLLSVSAMTLIQNVSLAVETPSISCTLETRDIETSIFVEQLDQTDPLNIGASLAAHFNHVEFRVSEIPNSYDEEIVLVTFSLLDYRGSLTSSGPLMTASKYLTCSSDVFQLLLNKPLEYIAKVAIQVIDVDYAIIKPIIDKITTTDIKKTLSSDVASVGKSEASSSSFLSSLGFPIYAKATCNTSEIRLNTSKSWCFYIATSQSSLTASISESLRVASEITFTDQEVGLLVTNISDNESDGVRRVTSLMLPSFVALFFLEESAKNLCGEMNVTVESFEVRTLALTSVLRLVRSEMSRDEVLKTIEAMKALSAKIETTFGGEPESTEKGISFSGNDAKPEVTVKGSKPFLFNLNLSIMQTVVVVPSLDSSLMLEVQNIDFHVTSFRHEDASPFVPIPLTINLELDDMIFILQNDTWSVHTSTILKIHLKLSYEASDGKNEPKQVIKISSEHFQVMLCQRVVEKLVEIESYLEEGLVGLEIYSSTKQENVVDETPSTQKDSDNPSARFSALQEFADRTTFKVALKNACFAWLFEEEYTDNNYASNPDAKGFLIGYNKLLITTERLRGRTLLNGVYITPTLSEHDIFHSQMDKFNAVNTAYLPQVELVMQYSCEKQHPFVSLNLSGDSLKISLLPSIVTIVVCAAKSLANTIESATLKTRQRKSQNSDTSSGGDPVSNATTEEFIKYSLPFSFRITIGFDGATISLWNSLDVTSTANRRVSISRMFSMPEAPSDPVNLPKNNTEPSLWLQAPAIDAVIEYSKEAGSQERDVLNGEIQISSSTNKIYPKVVPCIVEMSRLIQDVLKQSTLAPVKPESDTESILTLESLKAGGEIDLEEQFGNIILDVRIRLARQEIMLSCEPTARVAATVAYDEFSIGLTSSEEGLRKTSYSLSVRLANFKATLQHIYSREVSGMLSIDDIVLVAIKDRSSSEQQAILIAAKISDINTEINIKQSQDLELFQDIWYPGNPLGESSKRKSSNTLDQLSLEGFRQPNEALLDGGIMRKYRRVTSTTAIPWRIDFTLANVHGTVDLGQAVGQVAFTVDKFWLSSRKTSGWEQNLVLGFDEIKLVSEGRLGGLVLLKKLQLSTAIMWQRHDGGIHPVPLVQAILGIESLESRISFDFHSFALVSVSALHLSMFNQRDHNYILNDRLAAVGNCESISIHATSLAASNFLDLYYTLERMRREANASYNAILRDSARPGAEQDEKQSSEPKNWRQRNFKPFEKLRTFLDFNVQLVSVYIFPDSLVDLQVFTITLRGAEARYSQEIEHKERDTGDSESVHSSIPGSPGGFSTTSVSNPTEKQLVCNLDMKLTELMVALSTYRKPIARAGELAEMPISEYVARARETKGGTIIGIPICDISMQTWQDFESYSIVDYIFLSSFGGRVDVGWNLGSVTFIKGMWENHVKTFTSRRETYEMRSGFALGAEVLRNLTTMPEENEDTTSSSSENLATSSGSKSKTVKPKIGVLLPDILLTGPPPDSPPVVPLNDSSAIKDEEKPPVYTYRPLQPPVIAQPQLRDMGEATPPIEWIGLHRKKLPSLTHQAVIVSLQKMVEEVELVYRQVLGHS